MLELEPGSIEHAGHPEDPPHGLWGMRLLAVTRAFAMVGGTLFVGLLLMSLVSIIGRKLFSLPVPGDLEVMQMGGAVAVGTFFPYCQMADGHVKVDFFTTWLPSRTRAALDAIAALLLCAVVSLITWRTAEATITSMQSGEISFMLSWPVWITIALLVPSLALFALTGLYMAAKRFPLPRSNGKRRLAPRTCQEPTTDTEGTHLT